jgi:outer membrane lipoprotein-sorting protein
MIRRVSLALALLALMAPAARAQTLDEILAKHWEAEGGLDKIKAVQSYRYTGKMLMGPGMEAPFVMEKKRPNLMRMEFTVQGMTGVQAFDGKQGWMTMPFMGKKDPEAMPSDAQDQVAQQAEFDEPYLDSKARGIQVELVGKEDLEGTPAWKLKVTRKNGDVDFSYLDAETFLTLKQEGKRTVRGTVMDGESMMGDYKVEGGLMVPHSIESGAKGMPQRQKMTIEKVEVNPSFDDSHFTMPAVAASDTTKAAGAPAAAPAAPKSAAPKDAKKGAPRTPKGGTGTDTKKSG